jgi:holo-[acyl-carrier protein] synthase
VRVGTDVVLVEDVASSIDRFGDRYLRRVFTEHELVTSSHSGAPEASSLAARFAAKEATIKVLRPDGVGIDWRSMEVRRHRAGWCELSLSGTAARLAESARIRDISLSLSHEAGFAAAVVVALCDPVDDGGQS